MPQRLLPLLILLCGCYGKPQLPDVPPAPGEPAAVDASVARPTPIPQPVPQARRSEQLAGVLARLSEPDPRPAAQRDGAQTWRAPELEKLHELFVACCQAGGGPCAACSRQIAAARLPSDEVWPLASRFLGPLRPQADAGLPPLLEDLLGSAAAGNRDRAFRLLVGAGVVFRGQIAANGHAASTLPRRPQAGQPTWLLVERLTPCPVGTSQFKGPDAMGRMDVLIEPDCPAVEVEEGVLVPRVHRIVGTRRLASFPASGVRLHAPGVAEPILTVRAQQEASKPDDPSAVDRVEFPE